MNSYTYIQNIVEQISGIELVKYESRISNPRQVAVNWAFETVSVSSYRPTNRRRNARVVFSLNETTHPDAVRAKVEKLVADAIEYAEAEAKKEVENRAAHAHSTAAKEARDAAWIAKLRLAKSGQTENPLEGTENQFRVFSARQLMESANDWNLSIRVPLPADADKRAEYLAKLDSFLATL